MYIEVGVLRLSMLVVLRMLMLVLVLVVRLLVLRLVVVRICVTFAMRALIASVFGYSAIFSFKRAAE
ncbi:uncharacterized protein EV154DRAFT_518880 [Mucor mucedo]|uniref:uncharacterized protein n=1 Tax=Mucor mucedo TaxID=29922 RepID=UPI00222099A8|nr:uncharacterized protein EV154DRAFT_518880 [Mucor mucedo]KAI7888071.1 hypothetical protein EV154DRAFT_518880 [Mucor mucedo]